MYGFITILIIICCLLIILSVLIQNPKGGGLGASFGGVSNNLMGVQRTTDFLEKATWTFAITLFSLSLFTSFFLPDKSSQIPQSEVQLDAIPFQQQQPQMQQVPFEQVPQSPASDPDGN